MDRDVPDTADDTARQARTRTLNRLRKRRFDERQRLKLQTETAEERETRLAKRRPVNAARKKRLRESKSREALDRSAIHTGTIGTEAVARSNTRAGIGDGDAIGMDEQLVIPTLPEEEQRPVSDGHLTSRAASEEVRDHAVDQQTITITMREKQELELTIQHALGKRLKEKISVLQT